MEIGREHKLSKEIELMASAVEEEGQSSGQLLYLARVLADNNVATIEELKERLAK